MDLKARIWWRRFRHGRVRNDEQAQPEQCEAKALEMPREPRLWSWSGTTRDYSDKAPGGYVGDYRDHPIRGMQRWDGTQWVATREAEEARRARRPKLTGDGTASSNPETHGSTIDWSNPARRRFD